MDKMDYPRGLIRFTTQNALAGQTGAPARCGAASAPARADLRRGAAGAVRRPDLASLAPRTPLKVDVVRDRAALSRIVAGGKLENVYRLQIMNATEQPQRYRIRAAGLDGLVVSSEAEVEVGPAESRWVPVRLQIVLRLGSAGLPSHRLPHRATPRARRVSTRSRCSWFRAEGETA